MGRKVYLPTWMVEFPWFLKWFYRKLDVSKLLLSISILSNFWESFLLWKLRPFWADDDRSVSPQVTQLRTRYSYSYHYQKVTFQSLHVVRVRWRELLDDSLPQSRMTSPLWKEKPTLKDRRYCFHVKIRSKDNIWNVCIIYHSCPVSKPIPSSERSETYPSMNRKANKSSTQVCALAGKKINICELPGGYIFTIWQYI